MSLEIIIIELKNDGKKWPRIYFEIDRPLQSCCCPVQKYLPRMAELAMQLSRYLWRGLGNFKINSRPLFTFIFKLKNDNFKTWDFSPLIERVIAGVYLVARIWSNVIFLTQFYKLHLWVETLSCFHSQSLVFLKILMSASRNYSTNTLFLAQNHNSFNFLFVYIILWQINSNWHELWKQKSAHL